MDNLDSIHIMDPEKQSAWLALSTLGGQLPMMDRSLSVTFCQPDVSRSSASVVVMVPSPHRIAKGPLVVLGMMGNHANSLLIENSTPTMLQYTFTLENIWLGEGAE